MRIAPPVRQEVKEGAGAVSPPQVLAARLHSTHDVPFNVPFALSALSCADVLRP